ncbi:iron-sulfur cluster assembly scaffold protein [Candidatus Hydrogenedentota bacterium]
MNVEKQSTSHTEDMSSYDPVVRKYFEEQKYRGEMTGANGYGSSGIDCGETRRVWIKVHDEKIVDIRYSIEGCVPAVATCGMMSELAFGMSIDDAAELSGERICSAHGCLLEECLHPADQAALALYNAIMNYVVRSVQRPEGGSSVLGTTGEAGRSRRA